MKVVYLIDDFAVFDVPSFAALFDASRFLVVGQIWRKNVVQETLCHLKKK